MNHFSLDTDVAVITGGGTGIGLAIATCFVQAGAKVILTGRRPEPLIEACKLLGSQAKYLSGDVSEMANDPEIAKKCEALFNQPITILVNNAGINSKTPSVEMPQAAFDDILKTNVSAVFNLTRQFIPSMIENKRGSILMITSMASLIGLPRVAAYSASKAGLVGMIRSMAVEFGSHGIRINGIAPGFIETAMSRKALDNDPERKNRVLTRTPLGRMGIPEDIGLAAVYLSSDAARFVTGVNFAVDGGFSEGF